MNSTNVVVTGLGACTSLGGDMPSTWAGLLAGRSGVRYLDGPEYADLGVRIAARAATDPRETLDAFTQRRLDRYQQFGLIAAREAWADSGLAELAGTERAVPGERLAVAFSSAAGGHGSVVEIWETLKAKGREYVPPLTIARIIADGGAAWIALEFGAKAGLQTALAACATGNAAIRQGAQLIRAGHADVVIAGAAEAPLTPLIIAGFDAMRALSHRNDEPQRAARPFDKRRDGLVIGEGGAALILESAEHAARRGARVYAEVAGSGFSADGYDFFKPDPDGQAAAMRAALDDARLDPSQVVHVNAHAAGTPRGDVAESLAMREVFGAHVDDIVVTAPKSMLGHMMGGAGAIESITTILALYHRVVPPTLNLEDHDEEIVLDVATEPRPLPDGPLAALSNSFGLGGQNVVVAFRTI